jgi:two-component system OmpR family sensor kinase
MRVKLITAVLALVAIALATISIAGLGVLRNYLIGGVDSQLDTLVTQSQSPRAAVPSDIATYLSSGRTQPYYGSAGLSGVVAWIPSGGRVHWVIQETKGANTFSPPSGRGLSTPTTTAVPLPAVSPGASWLSDGSKATVGSVSGNYRYRVVAVPGSSFTSANGTVDGTAVIGLDVTSVYRTLGQLTGIDIIVSSILLAGIAILGVAVIRASLRPLTDIEKTAEAIAAGELSRRVPSHDPRTEVGRLGNSLNAMLAQIEAAFQARSASEIAARRSEDKLRQFVADASHELRTPLTAIRGFAEYYRQRGGVDTTGAAEIEAAPGRAQLESGPGSAAGHGPGPAPSDAATAGHATADPETADPETTGRVAPGPGSPEPGTDDSAVPEPPAPAAAGSHKLAPAELDRIMRRVEQESSRMGVLVEDMLLLARMDQQRPLEHRTVDLLTLAADAVHDARVVAPSRNVNLTVGAGAALLVLGDEVRLRQVIGNLMSNAMAHTPDGTPIDVRIRSGSLDEARGPGRPGPDQPGVPAPARPRSAAVLEVTDYGPGLTREQAERAFERFYRADQARTSGGSGLGLAIVASLVAAHGGAVWVESTPGAGATFRIALPLAPEAMHDDPDELGDAASLAPPRPLGTLTDVRPGPWPAGRVT